MEHKVVPVTGFKVVDDAQGIVEAFVSVTGAVDSVKDRIIPGAYEKTLVARTPKGVWSHNWDQPVSRTLSAEEVFPGDDRLPKKTRTGEDWPTGAGALLVKTQFNIGGEDNTGTQRARDAFSDVKFYGEDQEWSIGYNVPPGASKVDGKTGVRELSYIDLYEYSPVLFGAMPLTATAGVKDAQEAFKAAVEAGEAREGMVVESDPEEATSADISMGDVVVVPAGTPRADASRMLLEAMGKGQEAVVEGVEDGKPQLLADPRFVTGAPGFTEVTEDTPVTTPADPIHQVIPGHTGDAAGVEVEDRPDVEGVPAAEEPKTAEFVLTLTEKGREALEVLRIEEAPDPANLAMFYAERVKEIMSDPANVKMTPVEGKAMVTLTGSYEERQQALARQAGGIRDDFDLDGEDDWGYPRFYVTTEATFNNRVVFAAYDLMGEDQVRYFEAGYTFDGQQATLKGAREVRVEAAVAAKGAERGSKLAKAMRAFHEDLEEANAKTMLKVGRGKKALWATVEVKANHAFDVPAVKAAIEKALEPLVPDAAGQEAWAEPDTGGETYVPTPEAVTLSEADMLMLERLKLDA